MTLTAIVPSLRASIPEPSDPTLWPAHTVPGVDDVVISAVSMVRLAELVGTPCIHTAEQAPPRYRPREWAPNEVSVAVASVVRVHRPRRGVVLLELDAVLPACAVLDQVRLIGRVSTAPSTTVHVVNACNGTDVAPFHRLAAPLPGDLREGDLLCFPCLAAVRHRDVVEPVRAEVGAVRP